MGSSSVCTSEIWSDFLQALEPFVPAELSLKEVVTAIVQHYAHLNSLSYAPLVLFALDDFLKIENRQMRHSVILLIANLQDWRKKFVFLPIVTTRVRSEVIRAIELPIYRSVKVLFFFATRNNLLSSFCFVEIVDSASPFERCFVFTLQLL